jgi:hypothetical protein
MVRYWTRMTVVRRFLALILFLGLGLHLRFGWWRANPVAVLLMFPLIVLEGWETIEASKRAGRCETRGTKT